MAHARKLTADDLKTPTPVYAVWELTLRCDHACAHCGSRAVKPRPDELSHEQLIDVAADLIRLGTREVTLIGGEAYLYPRVNEIIQFLTAAGVRVTMQTGGRGVPRYLPDMRKAGLAAIGVSVDGPAVAHDALRASKGSHAAAMRAIQTAHDLGMIVTNNTQINRLNAHLLWETARELEAAGVRVWRAQLTVPMGRAADRPDWILEPWRIVEVIDTLAAIQLDAAERAHAKGLPHHRIFNVKSSNNLGYYGPHEILLRSNPGQDAAWWQGCIAGRFTIGIESDGTVKGCPSLPTAPYTGGKVGDIPLEEIWNHAAALNFVRDRGTEELWGWCKTCEYGEVCKAGCSFTAHCTLGKRGNNPFCYHRASKLAEQGKREVLVPVQAPSGDPYDFGRFEVQLEDVPAQEG